MSCLLSVLMSVSIDISIEVLSAVDFLGMAYGNNIP